MDVGGRVLCAGLSLVGRPLAQDALEWMSGFVQAPEEGLQFAGALLQNCYRTALGIVTGLHERTGQETDFGGA